MTDQELLDAGYVRYPAPVFTSAECIFQKRIDDRFGKKYFITVEKYSFEKYKNAEQSFRDTFAEYKVGNEKLGLKISDDFEKAADDYAKYVGESSRQSTGIPDSYEFTLQLYQEKTDFPVNINMFGGWSIEEAEKYAEKFWNMNCWRYYEEFEPEPEIE